MISVSNFGFCDCVKLSTVNFPVLSNVGTQSFNKNVLLTKFVVNAIQPLKMHSREFYGCGLRFVSMNNVSVLSTESFS